LSKNRIDESAEYTAIDTTYNTLCILYRQDCPQSLMDCHNQKCMKRDQKMANPTLEGYPIFYFLESE